MLTFFRPRRRRTNLDIHRDAGWWAESRTPARNERLDPQVGDLRYRGYSVVDEADTSSPEVPDYGDLMTGVPIWRDLVGYYTRFGDVREHLAGVDDRYVIMNAGDEMALEFAEAPPPPDGVQRDFVLVGDGWVKDGDYNTTFSTTVRLLPEHVAAANPARSGNTPCTGGTARTGLRTTRGMSSRGISGAASACATERIR